MARWSRLAYDVLGTILTLIAQGTPSEEERRMVFDQIARDSRVPVAALVLLDVRRADPRSSLEEVEVRTRALVKFLGSKLGPACAVIVPPRLVEEAEAFRRVGSTLGLEVRLFRDEPDARRWLESFMVEGSDRRLTRV